MIDNAFASLRRKANTLLAIGTMIPNPGFLGPIPYLLIFRMLMLVWVLAAYWMANEGYGKWGEAVLVFFAGILCVLSIIHSLPKMRFSVRAQHFTILLDIIFISWAFAISDDFRSDFYLFYFLPILAAAEYFTSKYALAYLILVALAYCLTLAWMLPEAFATGQADSFYSVLMKFFAPRELIILFVGIIFLSAFRLRRYVFNYRNEELTPLLSHNPLELNRKVDALLETITVSMGFQYATLSLVDRYKHEIRTVRWKNLTVLWLGEWPHSLDDTDIQVDVVNTRKTAMITGYDKRLDQSIYARFGHERLSRIFVPVIYAGDVVGTLEAGFFTEEKEGILTEEAIAEIEGLAEKEAQTIAQSRPSSMLQMAAERVCGFLGADSASIHLFQGGESIPYLEGSWGAVDAAFIHAHPFGRNRVGFSALENRRNEILSDERAIRDNCGDYHRLGIRTIAAIPMDLGEGLRGVLCVYYLRPYRFTRSDWELELFLTKPLQLAIKQNALSRSLAESHESAVAFTRFQTLIQSLSGKTDLSDFLEELAEKVLCMLNPENIVLYQFFREENRFETPPIMKGHFKHPEAMLKQIKEGDLVWNLIRDGESVFASELRSEPKLHGRTTLETEKRGFAEREENQACAALVLRDDKVPDGEPVGLLFINYRKPHAFSPLEIETMNDLASSAAVAIKSMRLHEQAHKNLAHRQKENEAFRAVDEALFFDEGLHEFIDLGKLILERALTLSEANVGDFLWVDRVSGKLLTLAAIGPKEKVELPEMEFSQGIIGRAASLAKPVLARDVLASEWDGIYLNQMPGTRSELAVPILTSDGIVLGVLNVEHPKPFGLDVEDMRVLETFAIQVRIAWHIATKNRQLKIQKNIQAAMSAITVRILKDGFDNALRLLLTGITSGSGLGFSRAMVFMVNEGNGTLEGKLGIGAQSQDEADETWGRLNADPVWTNERIHGFTEAKIQSVIDLGESIASGRERDSPLSLAVQKENFPMTEFPDGILKEVFENREARTLEDGDEDPIRLLLARVSKGDRGSAIAVVPMNPRDGGNPFGILIADFRFLYREKSLDSDDLELLEYFISVPALAAENVQYNDRIMLMKQIEAEKALIANAMNTIGSRVTSLDATTGNMELAIRKLRGSPDPVLLRRLDSMKQGVRNAKLAMDDLARFLLARQFRSTPFDLVETVKSAIDEGQKIVGFGIEPDLPSSAVAILGSAEKISESILQLFRNAETAMRSRQNQRPIIKIRITTEDAWSAGTKFARIEIEDNGPGVEDSLKKEIFSAFYSSDPNNTGLGLTTVREVVLAHKGTIEEAGTLGTNALFILRIPTIKAESNLEGTHWSRALEISQSGKKGQPMRILNPVKPKVLLLEKENSIREAISDFLLESGMVVQATEDIELAIKWIREMEFDLVIANLWVKKQEDGLAVLEAAKRRPSNPPRVIVTANRLSREEISAAKEMGAKSYINWGDVKRDFHSSLTDAMTEAFTPEVTDEDIIRMLRLREGEEIVFENMDPGVRLRLERLALIQMEMENAREEEPNYLDEIVPEREGKPRHD